MLCYPNAKINLGLNVIEKRIDGYHNIQSIFYPIPLTDALEIIEKPAPGISLTFSGIIIPSMPEDNLCYLAYHLIGADYSLPGINCHLHKIIPIGAGLGGGSADAAFFIKLLNEKFQLGISWGEQHHYARQLGSDCSFFITNKPAYVEQRGDCYEAIALDLSNYFLVLVYPNIHINTAEAYTGVTPKKPVRNLEEDGVQLPLTEWKNLVTNQFETSVFDKYQQLETVKNKLYSLGAVYASMSGSGSTLFGIFTHTTQFQDEFPNCFVWQGKL